MFNQRALGGILDQQSSLSRIQTQIASGKRIVSPSDDPSGSAQIIRLSQTKSETTQYIRNAESARTRLQLEEDTLVGVENALLRLRELALQAGNSTLSHQDHLSIASEVRQRLQELVGLANTQDANDEYLFSGVQTQQKPVSQAANGSFIYSGDQGQRFIQISSGMKVADGDSGSKVFVDIINGNGTFTVQNNSVNTGTGIVDPGHVFDSNLYVRDDYTISIVTNANGDLAYNVIGAATGQLIPSLPQNAVLDAPAYVAGEAIRFNGIETKIDGAPQDGDTFTITPSVKQNMFTSVENLALGLETNTFNAADRANVQNQINRSIVDMDRALDNLLEVRSGIGARLNIIEDKVATNESFLLEITSTLSDIQDLDFTAAAVELQQRINSLEAAQASFVRIQNLSLFNFL